MIQEIIEREFKSVNRIFVMYLDMVLTSKTSLKSRDICCTIYLEIIGKYPT